MAKCEHPDCDQDVEDEWSCDACGRLVYDCGKHASPVPCDCPSGSAKASTSASAAASSAAGDPFSAASALPPPVSPGAFARGVPNTLRKPRNRVVILSWNLQNFTGDQRCGRSNGAISSRRNQLRSAVVAAVLQALRVDVFLAMETGSDVGQAMASVHRGLGGLGKAYEPIQSERTHGSPEIRAAHRIECGFVRGWDVHALRNLSQVFDIEPGTLRPVSLEAVLSVLSQARSLPPWSPPPNTDPMRGAAMQALEAAKGDADLQGLLHRDLPTQGALDPAADGGRGLVEIVEILRHLRAFALRRRAPVVAHLMEILEALHLWRVHERVRTRFEEAFVGRLMTCGPRQDRVRLDQRVALCTFLLLAYEDLGISLEEGQLTHELDDARMVYDALQHFGCVEFHYETYGMLLRRDCLDWERFLHLHQQGLILRFGDDGRLLGTQKPGSAYNWRSALRMTLPLAGGRFLDTLLFHTRFTPSREALAADLKKGDGSAATQEAKALWMRSQSIFEVADHVINVDPRAPVLLLGDFNLPLNLSHEVLGGFAARMASLGYQRFPEGDPLTTLRSLDNLIEEPDAPYCNAYDGAYLCGIPRGHSACRILTLEELLPMLPPELLAELHQEVARVYERRLERLLERLAGHREQLGRARQDLRAYLAKAGAAAPCLAGSADWDDHLRKGAAVFAKRKFGDNGDLCAPVLLGWAEAMVALERSPEWTALGGRVQATLGRFRDDLVAYGRQLNALETKALVRFAVAYATVVSDHLPLLLEIDLDQAVGAPSSAGPASAGSGSGLGFSFSAFPSVSAPPANAAEFLRQQGRPQGAIDRLGQTLAALGRREGSASSDRNVCLLHTLTQLRHADEKIGAGDAAVATVATEIGVDPGPMLALGTEVFIRWLQRQGVQVRLYTLNLDGSFGGPIRIGADAPTAVWDILHYGAHYVPLWPAAAAAGPASAAASGAQLS